MSRECFVKFEFSKTGTSFPILAQIAGMLYITSYFLKKNTIESGNIVKRWGGDGGIPWGIWFFTCVSITIVVLLRVWQENKLYSAIPPIESPDCRECASNGKIGEGDICWFDELDRSIYIFITSLAFSFIIIYLTNKFKANTGTSYSGGGAMDKLMEYINPMSDNTADERIVWIGGLLIFMNVVSTLYIYIRRVHMNQTEWLSVTGYTSALSTFIMIVLGVLMTIIFGLGHLSANNLPYLSGSQVIPVGKIILFIIVLVTSIITINAAKPSDTERRTASLPSPTAKQRGFFGATLNDDAEVATATDSPAGS